MKETFWLIENKRFNSPAFYSENKCFRWTPFCEDVVRYETRQEACNALTGFAEAADCIVTEHSII